MASEQAHKIAGAVRKLRAVMEAFDMKGTNRATMLNAINTIEALNTRPAPAATDTGLETVRYEIVETLPSGTTRWKCVEHKLMANSIALNNEYPSVVNALCRRSQAEELLAAERAEKERLRGLLTSATYDLARANDECGALTIDNAAQAARIKELEAANIKWMEFYATSNNRAEALEAKLAAAEKSAFEHGYVMACCNIVNLHDEPTIAHCTLSELGVTRAAVKAMDLSEYDLKALRKIERDRSRSPYAKASRKARAVLGGKPS